MNMKPRQHHLKVLEIYRPQIVPLTDNLTAAVFSLMKILPAEFCLRRALEEELLNPQSLVVETSSGNMALGLAIVCNCMGYGLRIVTDYAVDDCLRRRMEYLGATVEIVPAPAANGGYQQARLDRLHQIRQERPEHWWLNQYDNPANPGAYGGFAGQLVEALGHIDCLVGAVGSGGSVCGTTTYLRELFPQMHTVGVDTFGSVLFGQPDQPRALRGLGNSILPGNLDHTLFDEVHWVSAAEAFAATRMLHRQTALFSGGTSGACWLAARYWAARNPKARVVCIFPDDGHRYNETIYNNDYLRANRLLLEELPQAPREVQHPTDAGPAWSRMIWGRRSYKDVVGELAVGVGHRTCRG
jgi:S-sulfo-L-cysteine synthase (3-phospho-L-serine-dependent)